MPLRTLFANAFLSSVIAAFSAVILGASAGFDLSAGGIYIWWVAFVHSCIFVLPATLIAEGDFRKTALSVTLLYVGSAMFWVFLADGPVTLPMICVGLLVAFIVSAAWIYFLNLFRYFDEYEVSKDD